MELNVSIFGSSPNRRNVRGKLTDNNDMKNLHNALFLFFSLLSINSFGQTWNWATQSTGSTTTGLNLPNDIVIDNDKNSYVVGQFDSPLIFGAVTLSPTLKNIFVAKFDSLGTCVWAKKAGAFAVSSGMSITIDQNQDLIICGSFYSSANFDTTTITSNGQSDIFIAKINSSGVWQWVKSYGGGSYDSGNQISTDINNNIYLTGTSVGTFMLDTCQINGLGGYDAFVARFSSSGTCLWVKNTLGIGNEKGTCITVSPNGTVYVGGVYSGDPIVFSDTLNSIGQIDEYDFISKLDSNGYSGWSKQLSCGAVNNMFGINGLVSDKSDNVYFTGNFAYNCQLDTFLFVDPPTALRNSYIAKLDSASNVLWAKKGSGPTNNWGSAIFVDENNYCFVTGLYTDSLNFYDCASNNIGKNGYIVKLDSLGNCMCIDDVDNLYPSSIYVNPNTFWLTGYFSNTATFGGYTLTTSNSAEIFVSNSTICPVFMSVFESNQISENLLLYPNPSSTSISINFKSTDQYVIEIYSSFGQLAIRRTIKSTDTININELMNGIYFVKIFNDQTFNSATLIKQ